MDSKQQILLFAGIFAMGALGFAVVQVRRAKWSARRRASARGVAQGSDGGAGFYPWMSPTHDAGSAARGEFGDADSDRGSGIDDAGGPSDGGWGGDAGGGGSDGGDGGGGGGGGD